MLGTVGKPGQPHVLVLLRIALEARDVPVGDGGMGNTLVDAHKLACSQLLCCNNLHETVVLIHRKLGREFLGLNAGLGHQVASPYQRQTLLAILGQQEGAMVVDKAIRRIYALAFVTRNPLRALAAVVSAAIRAAFVAVALRRAARPGAVFALVPRGTANIVALQAVHHALALVDVAALLELGTLPTLTATPVQTTFLARAIRRTTGPVPIQADFAGFAAHLQTLVVCTSAHTLHTH